MTPQNLPSSGPKKEIFIKALRDFSNACDMPELTPSCPFFEITKDGASCGEQCMDILSEFDDERSHPNVVDFGEGYRLIGRQVKRPRRGPKTTPRPFDVHQITAEDADRPLESKRITSLLHDLISNLATSSSLSTDSVERRYIINASMDELQKRGLDAQRIVRLGFGMQIALGIVFHNIIFPRVNVEETLPEAIITPDPAWTSLFERFSGNIVGLESPELSDRAFRFAQKVRVWLNSAELGEIIDWVAPTDLGSDLKTEIDRAEKARTIWLLDRFLLTYPDQWESSSLHLEWLYLHGQGTAPCPTHLMSARHVDQNLLATAIADHTTEKWRASDASSESTTIRVQEFAQVARDNLASGRHEVAAALYKGLAELAPEDAEVRNNYGFCLIPSQPDEALRELKTAERLGYKSVLINAANQILTLHLLHRDAEAIEIGTPLLQQFNSETPNKGWLWQIDDEASSRLILKSFEVQDYIARLLERISGGAVEPD